MHYAKEILKDLINANNRHITMQTIQKAAAEYYSIQFNDLLSPRRNLSVVRPRQMAMLLSKELTDRSLPEIARAFGRRDHTTVMHACRKIKELRETDPYIEHDYKTLLKILNP